MISLITNLGRIDIELDHEHTPNTSANFINYAESGHYDNTIFHRVIPGFMVQGGGFEPDMKQKKTLAPIQNEANTALKNLRGTVAMARTNDPHSATAQFFINLKDNHFLDHNAQTRQGWGYCVFGKVINGLDIIDKISQVKTTTKQGHDDVPVNDIIIEKVLINEQSES
jgi:peptidyl-prolyl cis-trans isomerase B (cyclophilin B)